MDKKIEHFSRMLRIFFAYSLHRSKVNYLPVRLWIEPTNLCNLHCAMCLNKDLPSHERGNMDFALFKKIIDEASGFAYDIYLHHRGESLLHPRIFDMVAYAKQKGLYTRLHTNATLLNREKSKLLLNSGLDFLSFSFDGYDKETYESIRCGANFEKTLANIMEFLKMKRKERNSSPFVALTLIDFSSKENKDLNEKRKRQFLRHFNSLPLDALRIRKPHNWGGDFDTGKVQFNHRRPLLGFVPCTFLWYALAISWNGWVVPCPQDFFAKLAIGNIKDNSLIQLWNSENERLLRDKMTRNSYKVLGSCNKCDRLWRKNIMRIPLEEVVPFLRDNFLGYRSLAKLFSLPGGKN